MTITQKLSEKFYEVTKFFDERKVKNIYIKPGRLRVKVQKNITKYKSIKTQL